MDWGKYLFCRFNAAPGIDMKEMSAHLKPSTWNVPLLSCATEPHFCSFLPQLSQKQKWIECHSAFFQLRLVAKQLQTSFSYSSLPCQQRQRSLCSMYVRCCMYQNASLLLGIILMSVNLFSWDAEEMVCCPLGVIPFSHICSQSLSGPLRAYSPRQSVGSKKQQFSEILTVKELIAVLPPSTAIFTTSVCFSECSHK